MVKIDMWYDDPIGAADHIDCAFYPNAGIYRGNLYSGKKIIGDYTATDSVELGKYFRDRGFYWRWE